MLTDNHIFMNIIAYPTTSHGIWRFIHTEMIISDETKLSGIYETETGINPISHGWFLDKYFILSKGNFNQNKTLKSLAMGYGNLSNGHQPIRT